MKKITLFLTALLVTMSVFAELKVDTLWEFRQPDGVEFKDVRNGFDYLNGELLFASRRAAETEVVIYDAATGKPKMNGTAIQQLKAIPDVSMAWAGGDVVVDANGAIYVVASNKDVIYKYANKEAEPDTFVVLPGNSVWAFDVKVDAKGDGCLLAAQQDGIKIFYVPITKNVAGEVKTIKFFDGVGGTPRFEIVDNKTFWLDGTLCNPTLIKLKDDFTIASQQELSSEFIVETANGVQQFEYKGKTYLACGANNHNTKLTPTHCASLFEIEVKPDTIIATRVGGFLPKEGLGANNSGTADEPIVVVKKDGIYFYFMAAGNGIAAYKIYKPTPVVTTMEELKAHAGEEVQFNNLSLLRVEGMWGYDYVLPDSVTSYIGTREMPLIPAKFNCKGIYDAESDEFTATEVLDIFSFFDFTALNMYVEAFAETEEQKTAQYGIVEPAIITFVNQVGTAAYCQYGSSNSPMTLVLPFDPTADPIAIGDKFFNMKGIYTPVVTNENGDSLISSATFELSEFEKDTVKYDVEYSTVESVTSLLEDVPSYAASALSLPKSGVFVLDADEQVWFKTEFVDWDETVCVDSVLVLPVAEDLIIEDFVGKKLELVPQGIFDVFNGEPIFYLQKMIDPRIKYESIAAMMKGGSQDPYGVNTSCLTKPVVVTYINNDEWMGATLFVQDATGALRVEMGVVDSIPVAVGDSIMGIEGFVSTGVEEASASRIWSSSEYGVNLTLTKVADGKITVTPATISELIVERDAAMDFENPTGAFKFANKVISLKNVKRVADPDDEKWPWIVQGEDSLKVSTYFWENSGIEMFDSMNIVGIADFMAINGQEYSIHPLNKESVTKLVPQVFKPGINTIWENKVADMEYKDIRNGFDYLNGELLFASRRNADTEVVIYNAANGDPKMKDGKIQQLKSNPDVSMAWAGGDVVVDGNGAIYVVASNKDVVYKYANKEAEPDTFVVLPGTNVWSFDVDVNAEGKGYLVAAQQNGVKIIYVPIVNNVAGEVKLINAPELEYGGVPHFDIVSEKSFWIDGAGIVPTLVTLNADCTKIETSKAVVSDIINATANGVKQFELLGKKYLVAAANNHDVEFTKAPLHSVALFELSDTLGLTQVGKTIPAEGFGVSKDNYANYNEPVVVVEKDAAYIYVMAGSTGIGAYKFIPEQTEVKEEKVATLKEFIEKANADHEAVIEITGELTVTHIYGGQIYLQDASAASLAYSKDFAAKLKAGNKLTGLVAKYSDNNGTFQIGIVTLPEPKEGVAVPDAKKIDEVNADILNRLVLLEGVELVSDVEFVKGKAADSSVKEGESVLAIRSHFKQIEGAFKAGDKLNITGIVSQFKENMQIKIVSIEKVPETAVDDVELNYTVYADNSNVFVEAEAGAMIEVYTIQGQRVYAAEAVSETTVIEAIDANIVIVRVNNEIHKVVLR